jgi:prepilin-type N-terminal cleavage/methylation domain-containing protein
MNNRGVTLLELMVVISVITIVTGILFLIGASLQAAYRVQDSKVTTQDSTRNAMMIITRELRQAAASSITADAWPATAISYRTAVDLSGNGWPVDTIGRLELSPVRTIALDADTNQLVLTEEGSDSVRVLATDLVPDTGVQFERVGGAVRLTLAAARETTSQGAPRKLVSTLSGTVAPRN